MLIWRRQELFRCDHPSSGVCPQIVVCVCYLHRRCDCVKKPLFAGSWSPWRLLFFLFYFHFSPFFGGLFSKHLTRVRPSSSRRVECARGHYLPSPLFVRFSTARNVVAWRLHRTQKAGICRESRYSDGLPRPIGTSNDLHNFACPHLLMTTFCALVFDVLFISMFTHAVTWREDFHVERCQIGQIIVYTVTWRLVITPSRDQLAKTKIGAFFLVNQMSWRSCVWTKDKMFCERKEADWTRMKCLNR